MGWLGRTQVVPLQSPFPPGGNIKDDSWSPSFWKPSFTASSHRLLDDNRPVPTRAFSSCEGTQGPSPLLKGSTGRAGVPLHRKQTCLFLEEIRSLFLLLTVCCLESFAGRKPKTCVAERNAAKTYGSSLDEFLFNCKHETWCVHKVKYLSQQKAFQNKWNSCKILVSFQKYMFNRLFRSGLLTTALNKIMPKYRSFQNVGLDH